MQANETKLEQIIEGTKQYVIPLFQRTYSWEKKEWDTLWDDLKDLCETEKPRSHFIGSIVNMPTTSVPEGVAKYLLIDGQQRLTTIFIILTLLRNKAKESGESKFAEEIEHKYLINPYEKDSERFKLLPTQVDRESYKRLIEADKSLNSDDQITKAYNYFEKKLKQTTLDYKNLKTIITKYFSVVSIVLDKDDNPYLVFESLNAKGKRLTEADLIRNYFFMRIHINEQDKVYNELWMPMQNSITDLTEYIRHFLMRKGTNIKQREVYETLKRDVNENNAIEYLKELFKYSNYYQKLLEPKLELDAEIGKYLNRLNEIEVTTAYPLLLFFYNNYDDKKINREVFISVLKTIENYLIRRYICGIPSNSLNKIFPSVSQSLESESKYKDNLAESIKIILQSKDYPKDAEFKQRLKTEKLYGAGDNIKTKLILESMEGFYEHKEVVSLDNKLTIEHILPQTLTEWWKKHLGADWESTHELYCDSIGNLTLTGYNPELNNDDFPAKKVVYKNSHLELNKYFSSIENWNREEVEKRSENLANIAIKIWPYFGQEKQDTTETTPKRLWIFGQSFEVKSWLDVLEKTINTLSDKDPGKIDVLMQHFPQFIGKDKNEFWNAIQLKNGVFIEGNPSSQSLQKICYQAIDNVELTSDEWKVETV